MKKILGAALLALGATAAQAQQVSVTDGEWFHAAGYDYAIGIDLSTLNTPFSANGLAWAPRYTVPLGDELSVGLTAPLGLSLAQSSNGSLGLGYHGALAATVQLGMESTKASNAWLGAFINVGYGTYGRQVRNFSGIGPAFVRDASVGSFSELGVRYDYWGNEINLSFGLLRVPTSVVDKADVVTIRLLYGLSY